MAVTYVMDDIKLAQLGDKEAAKRLTDAGGLMTPERLVVRTDYVVNGNLWQCFPVINVDKVKDIPADYPGAMGVPITFLDKFSREQFEILDCVHHVQLESGRHPYRRLVVRNLHPDLPEYIDLADWFRKMGVPLDIEFLDEARLAWNTRVPILSAEEMEMLEGME